MTPDGRSMVDRKSKARVVIVGAGPVGMVCALALNRRGVPVTVFEQEPEPSMDQRAATIHPSTLEMLDDLGVTRKIIPLGMVSTAYRFHDRVTNSVVAEFDLDLMRDEFRFPFVLQYEQYKLTASITAEYANAGDFDVRFSHGVTGLTQTADDVDVEIATPDGSRRMRADYVIGCDGGRSIVRKFAGRRLRGLHLSGALHQDRDAVRFRDGQPQPRAAQLFLRPQRVVQPVQGAAASEPAGLWRAIFPIAAESETRTGADRRSGSRRACRSSFPRAAATRLDYVNVYGAHQRVASTFRDGPGAARRRRSASSTTRSAAWA